MKLQLKIQHRKEQFDTKLPKMLSIFLPSQQNTNTTDDVSSQLGHFCYFWHGHNFANWPAKQRLRGLKQISVRISRKEPKCRMRETNIYWYTKHFRGVHRGEQSWNYSKQQERTKPPEVDSLESSPSRYQWKIICARLGWQTAWGNQQAGSLRLVEQDWREHSAQTHKQDSTQNYTINM